MVASMACKSHLSLSTAQKILFKYVYKTSVRDYVTTLEAQNCTSNNKFKIIAYEVPTVRQIDFMLILPKTNAL